MKIKYPVDVVSDEDKLGFILRLEELLRLDFNKNGENFRKGLLKPKDWETYVKGVYGTKKNIIIEENLSLRKKLKEKQDNPADLNISFEE